MYYTHVENNERSNNSNSDIQLNFSIVGRVETLKNKNSVLKRFVQFHFLKFYDI